MFFRSGFEKKRVSKNFTKPSMTKQCFKEECDINHIMKKYRVTGILEHQNRFQGDYTDCSGVVDYQTALQMIMNADEAFMTLPAKVRSEFNNDPGSFIEFATNPANEARMVEMGLKKPAIESKRQDGVGGGSDNFVSTTGKSKRSKGIGVPDVKSNPDSTNGGSET